MSELENLNMGELCVHYKVCRIKPCGAHCGEYLPKDYFVTDRPHGEWEKDGHHIRCKNCNEYMCETDREGNKIPTNFCPNCGSDNRK